MSITREQSHLAIKAYIEQVVENEDNLKADLACHRIAKNCDEFHLGCSTCDGKYGRCEILQNLAKYFKIV